MNKTILYVAMTLDGFIARENGDVDFLTMNPDEDYGYAEFVRSVDHIVMGFKTYEKSLTFPGNPFTPGKTHHVLTRKSELPKDERVEFVQEGIQQFMKKLKAAGNKNIWFMGGGDVLLSFLKLEMIDELMVFVIPLVLGSGIPLFKVGNPELVLKLKESQNYSDGIVKLHYLIEDPGNTN